jgi:hypothetical protein
LGQEAAAGDMCACIRKDVRERERDSCQLYLSFAPHMQAPQSHAKNICSKKNLMPRILGEFLGYVCSSSWVPLSSRFIKKSKLPVKYFFYL